MHLTCGNRSDNHPTARLGRVVPRFADLASAPPPRWYPAWSPGRYSVSLRVTSTPPTSREVRLYTTAPIVDIAVISTMLTEPSRAVYPSTRDADHQVFAFTPGEP